MEIGRNDPCPYGSGKKYKKCCSENKASPRGVLERYLDFGSSDPFCARIMFQIFQIRDFIYPQSGSIGRKNFDEHYDPIYQNLLEAKIVKERAISLIHKHTKEVEDEKIARLDKDLIRAEQTSPPCS